MEKFTQRLQCGQCLDGTVNIVTEFRKKHTETSIKKCDKCKYQYGLKQIETNQLKEKES